MNRSSVTPDRHRILVGLVGLLVFALLVLALGGKPLRPEAHRLVIPGGCTPSAEGAQTPSVR